MQVCKTYDGSHRKSNAQLGGCVELAQRLRVNLEVHGVRERNGISRWYLQWIEADLNEGKARAQLSCTNSFARLIGIRAKSR